MRTGSTRSQFVIVSPGAIGQNDSNHRYLTDAGEYARMQMPGWVPEGVVL